MLAIDLSFLLGSFKLNLNDKLSLNKKLTFHLLKGKLPQLPGGSTWLTPGYGHLSLKAPLCWQWVNHTKNDQPGNYETRLGALWTMPLERATGMELSGFVALIYGLYMYRDGFEGVAWNSHEF